MNASTNLGRRHLLIVGLIAASCCGCGDANPALRPVAGKVTWNKQPLAEGYINFEPFDAARTASGGPIKQGMYAVQASPGRNRVQISAMRSSGKVDPQMGAAPQEQYLPACYNTETKLEADISASGKNEFQFDLAEMP